MLGKIAAGIVCGAAGALPARYFMESTIAAFGDLIRGGAGVDFAIAATPFVFAALVVLVCWLAPHALGAWFRGCLFVAIVCLMGAFQLGQCFAMGWFFESVLDDPFAARAATSACPDDMSAGPAVLMVCGAVIFGVAAFMIWRHTSRTRRPDF